MPNIGVMTCRIVIKSQGAVRRNGCTYLGKTLCGKLVFVRPVPEFTLHNGARDNQVRLSRVNARTNPRGALL